MRGGHGIIPQEYRALPLLGQIYNSADMNVEELALTDPHLILDVGQELSARAEELDGLQERTNIPAVYVASSLETMPETFRTLGVLLGGKEFGAKTITATLLYSVFFSRG